MVSDENKAIVGFLVFSLGLILWACPEWTHTAKDLAFMAPAFLLIGSGLSVYFWFSFR